MTVSSIVEPGFETLRLVPPPPEFSVSAREYTALPLERRMAIAGDITRQRANLTFGDAGYRTPPLASLESGSFRTDCLRVREGFVAFYDTQRGYVLDDLIITQHPIIKVWADLTPRPTKLGGNGFLGWVELTPDSHGTPGTVEPTYWVVGQEVHRSSASAYAMTAIIDATIGKILIR